MTSSPLTTTPVSAVLTVPADRAGDAVVGAPCPDVVEDHVVAVDLEAGRGLADVGSADAEEHVLQRGRVLGVPPCLPPLRRPSDAQQRRAS